MVQFTNSVLVAGSLVADLRIVNTQANLKDGSPFQVAEGTLAINNNFTENPVFVTIQLSGYMVKRITDANKHLKGSTIGVLGLLVNEIYKDQNEATHSKVKVKVADVMFGQNFYANFNSVTLYGHVANEPNYKAGEKPYTRMSIGNSFYDAYKKERVSSFFNLVGFGKKADFMGKYFKKGDALLVQAHLSTSKYEKTQPDGSSVTKYSTELIVDDISFAQKKSTQNNNENSTNSYTAPTEPNFVQGSMLQPELTPQELANNPFDIRDIDAELPF